MINAPLALAKETHVSESKPRDEGRGDGESWRVEALNLGVNPDEPDDWKYWSQLERARNIVDSFRYHQPAPEQIERISTIRQAHIALAKTILRTVRVGADQTHALRTVHESMMTCNKAIVNEPTPAAPDVLNQRAVDLTSLL